MILQHVNPYYQDSTHAVIRINRFKPNNSRFAFIYIYSTASVRYKIHLLQWEEGRFPNSQSIYHTTLVVFLCQSTTTIHRQFFSVRSSIHTTYWFSCSRVLGWHHNSTPNLKGVFSFYVLDRFDQGRLITCEGFFFLSTTTSISEALIEKRKTQAKKGGVICFTNFFLVM